MPTPSTEVREIRVTQSRPYPHTCTHTASNSVYDSYSKNLDPSKNRNPDPDPSCFLTLPGNNIKYFFLNIPAPVKRIQLKDIGIFQLAYVFFKPL